jgi:hypothetical protein
MLGKNAFERNNPLEPLNADGLRLENLSHAPDIDAFEEVVLAEGNWFVQASSVRVRSRARAFPLSASKGPQVKRPPVVMVNRGPTIQTRHTLKIACRAPREHASVLYSIQLAICSIQTRVILSPLRILSTTSIPEITWPNTVCLRSRCDWGLWQMKNCEPPNRAPRSWPWRASHAGASDASPKARP